MQSKTNQISSLLRYHFKTKVYSRKNILGIISASDLFFVSFYLLSMVAAFKAKNFVFNEQTALLLSTPLFSYFTFTYSVLRIFPDHKKADIQVYNTIPVNKSMIRLSELIINWTYILKTYSIMALIPSIIVYKNVGLNLFLIFNLYSAILLVFGVLIVELTKNMFHALSFYTKLVRFLAIPFALSISLVFVFLIKYNYPVLLWFINLFTNKKLMLIVCISVLLFSLLLSLTFNDFEKKPLRFSAKQLYFGKKNPYEHATKSIDSKMTLLDPHQLKILTRSISTPFYNTIIVLIIFNNPEFNLTMLKLLAISVMVTFSMFFAMTDSILYSSNPKAITYFETTTGFSKTKIIFKKLLNIWLWLFVAAIGASFLLYETAYLNFLIIIGLNSTNAIISFYFLKKSKMYGYLSNSRNDRPISFLYYFLSIISTLSPVFIIVFFEFNFWVLVSLASVLSVFTIWFLFLTFKMRYSARYRNYAQRKAKDCGLASLKTLLYYYGIKFDKNEYNNELLKNENKEFSFQQMIDIAKSKSIILEAYQVNNMIDNKQNINFPIIAQIRNKNSFHFVVIFEILNNKVIISNPSWPFVRTLNINKILFKLTGNILMIKGDDND